MLFIPRIVYLHVAFTARYALPRERCFSQLFPEIDRATCAVVSLARRGACARAHQIPTIFNLGMGLM